MSKLELVRRVKVSDVDSKSRLLCYSFNENLINISEIKHVFLALIAWWIQEQISENLRHNRGFSPAWEFSQILLMFSTDYGGMDNMFYFF